MRATEADAGQAQFEADKRAVYKHPLFPLLALLLERCEQATAGATVDAFDADLQAFVQHQRRDQRPFLVNEPEIDSLMIKSIQVLSIHLLELEKVQELCRDFCGRYIACLKAKMQSENLLRSDHSVGFSVDSENNMSLSSAMDDHSSTSDSPQYQQPFVPHSSEFSAPRPEPIGTNSIKSCSSVSGSPPPDLDTEDASGKRGVLPRHATQVMRAWLFQHLVHPYPTEEEKRTLASQTRLTLLQVNNWFINARRRILQPMLGCSDKPALLSSSEDEENNSGDEREGQAGEENYPVLPQSMQ